MERRMYTLDNILAWFPNWKPKTIFDIGANVGIVTLTLAQYFPEADIFAFEPFPAAYASLKRKTEHLTKVERFPYAFSSKIGKNKFTSHLAKTANRLDPKGDLEVWTTTGQEFCDIREIDHIGFLKIDTEGNDLEVLKGFGDKLKDCDFVTVEAAANPHVKQCVQFRDIDDYIRPFGFHLFGFNEFAWEFKQGSHCRMVTFPTGEMINFAHGAPLYRRMDPVYINTRLVGPLKD